MTARDPRARLLHSAALTVPAGAILVLGFLAGGPSTAPAGAVSTPALDPALFTPATPSPSPELTRTLQWLTTVPMPAPGQSPMVVAAAPQPVEPPPAEIAAAPEAPAQSAAPTEPVRDPAPALKLTALLGASTGGIAVIDGHIRTEGQFVAPGWRLTRVDAAADSIEITHDDGRTERFRLRRDRTEPD